MEKTLNSLEYRKITEALKQHAVSIPGKELCEELVPMASLEDAERALNETAAAVELLLSYGVPSFSSLHDVRSACARAKNSAVLSIKELLDVADTLKTAEKLRDFLESRVTEDGVFYPYYRKIVTNRHLAEKLTASFTGEEEFSDDASPELKNIRRKQLAAKARVKSSLDNITRSSSYQKYLQENIVTVRNGRYVIPVKAEYRNEINGLVHDTSSSGATLFIEPLSVVQANNELAVLESEERRETERILSALSADVGMYADIIAEDFSICRFMDFCFAKARYADELKAVRPALNKNGIINIERARHPLISKDICVPIDVELGDKYTALIVTGPNTGGKTVSLKTTGLLCLMAKSGLFVPAKSEPEIAYFDNVFADIGDEQSIEQSLSTFSAHMKNIIDILSCVTENSLVLLDELGSGTDPEEGAALAIAIIEYIQSLGAKVMCTTHYAELKLYALQTSFVENASCEFDVATLKPTYRLITGIPGKSNAFAIAARLGLDELIIDSAKYHMDAESVKFEKVIADLEINRKTAERDAEEAQQLKKKAEEEVLAAEKLRQEIRNSAEEEIKKARKKAAEILDSARRQADKAIDELDALRKENEKKDFKEKIAMAKANINAGFEKSEKKLGLNSKPERKKPSRPFMKGDAVRIYSLDKQGTLMEDPTGKKKAEVLVGIIKMQIPVDDLELCEQKAVYDYTPSTVINQTLSRGNRSVQTELDIRGMTALDADGLIDGFLDDCSLSGLTTVSIIHGKGTGALRSAVWQKLKKNKLVKEFRLGVYGEGESGVTIVTLK